MEILYYRPTCPFCLRVLDFVNEKGIELDLRNISGNEAAQAELVERGGKSQVPYLVDEAAGISMYESADIIEYLKEKHGD